MTAELRFLRGYLRPEIILFFLLPLAVYYPVFVSEFLFHDDWHHSFIKPFHCSRAPMAWTFNTLGRPIANAILCVQFSLIESFADAAVVRLTTVGFVGLMTSALYLFLRRAHFSRLSASGLAIAAGMLPGVAIYTFWIGSAFILFSLWLAVIAAYLTIVYPDTYKHRRRVGLAIVLVLLMGFLTYQVGTMLYPILIFIAALQNFTKKPFVHRTVRSAVLFIGMACVIYALWYVGSGYAGRLHSQDATRGLFFSQLGSGMFWFLESAWPRAARLWFPFFPAAAGVFGAAFVIGLFGPMWSRRISWRLSGLYILGGILVAVFSFSPVLVSSFRYETFRFLVPLSLLTFAVPWVAISHVRVPSWLVPVRVMAAMALLVFASVQTHRFVADVLVAPNARELQSVSEYLTGSGDNIAKYVRVPGQNEMILGTDEVLMVSSDFEQNIDKLLLRTAKWKMGREIEVERVEAHQAEAGEAYDFDEWKRELKAEWRRLAAEPTLL